MWQGLPVSANVSVLDGEHYTRSVENLRRCAAQASALDVGWPHVLRWVLKALRIDLCEAATALLGLSNTFGVIGRPDASFYRRQAGKALRLPAASRAMPPKEMLAPGGVPRLSAAEWQ